VLSVWSKRCRGKEEGRSSSSWAGAALAGDDEEDVRMKSASPGPFLTSSANVDAVLLPSATTIALLDASQAFIFQEIIAQYKNQIKSIS
jgi:hypothetical protein